MMSEEWLDFQTAWEQRFLEVAEPFLDPKPEMVEGSAKARFATGATLAVIVSPGGEVANGYLDCEIIAEYAYDQTEDPGEVSETWGQILEAFGNGRGGESKLRTRLAAGRLVIPGGINSIQYDRQLSQSPDDGIKQFAFSAVLGMLPPN